MKLNAASGRRQKEQRAERENSSSQGWVKLTNHPIKLTSLCQVEVEEKEEALKESTELMEMYAGKRSVPPSILIRLLSSILTLAGKLAKAEKRLEDEVSHHIDNHNIATI